MNTPKKSEFRGKENQEEFKLKRIQEKVSSGSFDLDDICDEISEMFIDTRWEESQAILSEAEALENSSNKPQEIFLKERSDTKVLDTPEFFYEYIMNNAGELKPFLKRRDPEQKVNPEPQVKKRGRPPKKNPILTEDEDDIVKIAKRMGLKTHLDMSNILMLVHKPQSIVILQTNYGTKLGYVEVADKEILENYNIYNC